MLKPSLRIDVFSKTLFGDNLPLVKGKKGTRLGGDATSGLATIKVISISRLAVKQVLCVGEIGDEETEIIKTHASTAPSGTTVTLASNLTFSHPQDTKVYVIDWDYASFEHSSTATGTKGTASGTIAIQADQKETLYKDWYNTTGYAFLRFFNSTDTGGTYSVYSDAVPYAGYDDNTVWAIKQRALDSVDEEIGSLITHEFLNKALWQGRREYHDSPGKRPFRMRADYVIGTVTVGMYRLEVPADLEDPHTAENIFGIRIGTEENMRYHDKKAHDESYEGVSHTTLADAYDTADGTIHLTDVRDFTDSGSIQIEDDTIDYDARHIANGTLSVETAGDDDHSADLDVWQDASLGLPDQFTVFTDASSGSNYIAFENPIETSYVYQNIYIDYYRTLVPYDSDADVLDESNFDMYVPYLAWRIKKRKNKGLNPLTDPDFIEWQSKKNNALATEYLGQEVRIEPDIDHLPLP